MRRATVQERRNERGSGIGRRMKKVDPTGHQQERCGERGLEKWEGKAARDRAVIFLSLWCRRASPPSEKPSVFSPAHFFPVSPCTSPLPSLSVLLCPPRPSSVSMFCPSLLPSVHLSTSLTPSPRVLRWPLLSAFLLPLCSTCVLPGCISSSPASPKRY